MDLYTYRCYVEGQEPNLWQRWYSQNPAFQGTHDSIFEILEQQDQWGQPYTKKLKNCDGLIEVCLNGNIQWRIFGFWGSKRKEFIVVAVGNHKQNVYTPRNILKTAKSIMNKIRAGNLGAKTCERPQ